MKVLIAHARYAQPAGEEAVIDAQTQVLTAAGHEVERFEQDNSAISGVAGAASTALRSVWSPAARRDMAAVVQRFQPDVLHVHNNFHGMSPSIYGAAHNAGIPVVQHVHNARLVCINAFLERDGHACTDCVGKASRWPGVVHRCYRDALPDSLAATAVQVTHRTARTWARSVDRFLAVSGSLAEILVTDGVVPAPKMSVCLNGMARDPGVREPDLDEGYALFAGRLSPEKGVDVLLRAAAQVPELRVVVAGDGPAASALRADAAALPNVEFVGHLERAALEDKMRKARVVVVPSIGREPFAMSLIEAAALGVPAIASDTGGIGEVVGNGVTGRLVAPGDASSLAAALRLAAEDPATFVALGRAARARFEAEFSADAFRGRLLAAYASVGVRSE